MQHADSKQNNILGKWMRFEKINTLFVKRQSFLFLVQARHLITTTVINSFLTVRNPPYAGDGTGTTPVSAHLVVVILRIARGYFLINNLFNYFHCFQRKWTTFVSKLVTERGNKY